MNSSTSDPLKPGYVPGAGLDTNDLRAGGNVKAFNFR